MGNITTMTMEEYKWRMRNGIGTGLVPPKIATTKKFELPRHILSMLKDLPLFLGSNVRMFLSI